MDEELPQQDDTGETRSPQHLRQALTDALGLPAETFLVEILLGETTPPIVRCHFYPSPEAMERAVALFAEYQLVAKPREIAPEPGPMLPPTSSLVLPDAQSER
jgi:hypothetical protein